jgi:hypothetical protein
MTKTSNDLMKARLLRPTVLLVLGWLAVSCATTVRPPQTFLFSTDDSSNQWLDKVVDVDVAEVRIIHLPLTDAFAGMKLAMTRADAPVEALRVSLHANEVTRRQALWLLAEKYGLDMTVAPVSKQSPYISISKE